jgi:RNA polymerase sigma factor (sigma-70 family)
MEEVPEPQCPPSSAMGNAAESEILVQQLMALLGPEDRACLTLAYSVGLSLEEISVMMDLPVGSVKSRIHRAKLKLQQWMDDHDHSLQTTETGPQPEQRHAG